MFRLAGYASGSGSNALRIMEYFHLHSQIVVALIVTNRKNAGVLVHAEQFGVPTEYLSPADAEEGEAQLRILEKHRIDGIVLAGYLRKIPVEVIARYPDRILNIHPSLLPKFGGPGMYGLHVHRAVAAAGETISGPTIHLVNEEYDKGRILFQSVVDIEPDWTPEQIQSAVLAEEHRHYSPVIEKYFSEMPPIYG